MRFLGCRSNFLPLRWLERSRPILRLRIPRFWLRISRLLLWSFLRLRTGRRIRFARRSKAAEAFLRFLCALLPRGLKRRLRTDERLLIQMPTGLRLFLFDASWRRRRRALRDHPA